MSARTEAANVEAESVEKTNHSVFGVDLPILFQTRSAWSPCLARKSPRHALLTAAKRFRVYHEFGVASHHFDALAPGAPTVLSLPAVLDRSSSVAAQKFALRPTRRS
jgi:hypothetical protein